MAEYFLIVDDEDGAERAAELLRQVWPRVEIANSVGAACTRIAALDPSEDGLVLVADARLLEERELKLALAARPEVVVMVAAEPESDQEKPAQALLVRKPYDDGLADQTEDAVARLRMRRVLRHVVSILMTNSQCHEPHTLRVAGSGCLVKLPQRSVILTAEHVVSYIQRPGVRTYIAGNGPPVEITAWPIVGVDASVDIATIGIPVDFDPEVIKSRFYVPPTWPPTRAMPGNAVLMVGFPSEHRIGTAANGPLLSHGALFSDFVSSSSMRHFVVAPEELDRRTSSMTDRFDAIDDTGGMSGCPMFVGGYRERPELRGVLKEGSSGSNAVFLGAHTDFVRSDGTIDDDLTR